MYSIAWRQLMKRVKLLLKHLDMFTKNRPFFEEMLQMKCVNISCYFLILLHNPDILDISMVKEIDYALTL